MKTISFKVSEDEDRLIRSLAKREQSTLSEYLRRRAVAAGPPPAPPPLERCDLTGAMIFAAAPDTPPLTTRSVREWLADFP